MKIDDSATIVRSGAPVETTVGSEVVLMTLSTGECMGLGETGSDVWRLLSTPMRLPELVAALGAEYQPLEGVIEGGCAGVAGGDAGARADRGGTPHLSRVKPRLRWGTRGFSAEFGRGCCRGGRG